MKIVEKIKRKQADILWSDPINIVFLGDSVTQGCFECFIARDKKVVPVTEYQSAFSSKVRDILNFLYPRVQFNVINCGVSGASCWHFATDESIARYVTAHHPDLTVVSFGLNDSGKGFDGIAEYENSLKKLFNAIKNEGSEIVFITENTVCDRVSEELSDDLKIIAEDLKNRQNSGLLKTYFDAAKIICEEFSVPVIDGYSFFEKLRVAGVDTNELMAGHLNHPVREYHRYLAVKIVEKMLLV